MVQHHDEIERQKVFQRHCDAVKAQQKSLQQSYPKKISKTVQT